MAGGLGALIESVAGSLAGPQREDFRTLMNQLADQVTRISPGGVWQQSSSGKAASAAAPAGVGITVTAANGVYSIALTSKAPAGANPAVFYEVSYSPVKAFTGNVTTLPPSASGTLSLSLPGATVFFRARASFDQVNWSPYTLAAQSAVQSGLVSSAAIADGAVFNQTNFLTVDSIAAGSTANVRVYGAAGVNFGGVAVRGDQQLQMPGATIINVAPASEQFVGHDGSSYALKPTLAAVLADKLTPIGRVEVVGVGQPTYPTVVPVIQNGAIVGYNVTNGGAGATTDYVFTINGKGAGATTGSQTFKAGVLESVAPGNAGSGYDGSTTVTASGGRGAGTAGGGTALGGNGGRMSAV